jgi:hypothetical protein
VAETYNNASWTASDLLTSIYRACRLPDSGTLDYSPSVVLTLADEAIHNWAGHLIASARDGRAVTQTLASLASDSADSDGQSFELPPMAIANTIESVKWVDDEDESNVCSLQLIPAGMEGIFSRWTDRGTPTSYALFNETLKVYPAPEARGSLRITYMRRHGQLVVGADTTSVVAVLSTAFDDQIEVQVTSNPSSLVTGVWVDAYSQYYPYRLKRSARIAGHFAGTLTLDAYYDDWSVDVDPSDTLVIYGKTPYVSLPLEMKGPLVQQIAQQITAELGDLELSTGYNNLAKEGSARIADMMSPRAKSDKQKLVNHNSLARGGYRRRFWGGRGA